MVKTQKLFVLLVLALASICLLVACNTDCKHSGGTATCISQAVCKDCGKEYGELTAHDYHDGVCKVCGEPHDSDGDDNDNDDNDNDDNDNDDDDDNDDDIELICGHIGGAASCTHQAECEDCGKEYGKYADHNFDGNICTVCSAQKPTALSSFEYEINKDEVSIAKFVGDETEVIIPDLLYGYPVRHITDEAFFECSTLISVVIPSRIRVVGNNAFQGCTSLSSVTISSGVTDIYSFAFSGCTSLSSITIPDSVTQIGMKTFYDCSNLTNITLSKNLASMGSDVFFGTSFWNAAPDNSIVYVGKWVVGTKGNPDTVLFFGDTAGIADYAVSKCTEITSVDIPNSVKYLGRYAFSNCGKLQSVTIGNGIKVISGSAFFYCGQLTNVTIGNSVEEIDSSAFADCRRLTNISIPDSVTTIGALAFRETGIWRNAENDSVVYADKWAVGIKGATTTVTLKNDTVGISNAAFSHLTALTNVTIPSGVKYLNSNAFANCSGLTSISIPDGVTSISDYLFGDCYGLTSISIPNSVTSIGDDAFANCSGLTSITIPDGLISIGDGAFFNCDKLTSITIPSSVTSISEGAFTSCSSLSDINIDAANTNYIYQNGSLIDLSRGILLLGNNNGFIPKGIFTIGVGAFMNCDKLTSISVPGSVSSIGDGAFVGCNQLASITIGKGVNFIAEGAFYDCNNLKKVYYAGGKDDWDKIEINNYYGDNSCLFDATLYYYSKTQPQAAGNYWRYIDNTPTEW